MSNSLIKTIANIISVQLISLSERKSVPISTLLTPKKILFASQLFDEKKINNKGLTILLEAMIDEPDKDPQSIVDEQNLIQTDDEDALLTIVKSVIEDEENGKPVSDYMSGKEQALGFLVGQCMKLSKGSGNPQMFKKLLSQEIGKL